MYVFFAQPLGSPPRQTAVVRPVSALRLWISEGLA